MITPQVLEREFAKPAMELIQMTGSKTENQRYAGALVLRELADYAPAVLYDRRTAFFDAIWLLINDLTVRTAMCLMMSEGQADGERYIY